MKLYSSEIVIAPIDLNRLRRAKDDAKRLAIIDANDLHTPYGLTPEEFLESIRDHLIVQTETDDQHED